MVNEKKASVLYVLDILQEYTDSNHTLTYAAIKEKLWTIYNIEIERKTIARDIDVLVSKGYDIVKRGNLGVYLAGRKFEEGELLYLIDAIYSSRSIPTKYAQDLVTRLTEDYSIYDKKRYNHLEKLDEEGKNNNKQIFYTIEILNEAIEQGKKVEFQYSSYTTGNKIELKYDGKKYKINPYFMVNNHGKYYLVCNYEKYNNLANYKIENISNICIIDEKIRPLEDLDNMQNFSIKKYMKEHIYMVTGESVLATIKIDNPKRISDIIGWFGEDLRFYTKNGETFADVQINEWALVYWALQYGNLVEVTHPQSVRDKICDMIEQLKFKYINTTAQK